VLPDFDYGHALWWDSNCNDTVLSERSRRRVRNHHVLNHSRDRRRQHHMRNRSRAFKWWRGRQETIMSNTDLRG
jgi:hypothetical protein